MSERSRKSKVAPGVVRLLFIVAGIVIWILARTASPGSDSPASSQAVVWDTYDVAIDVRKDGSVHVAERQEVTFNGTFTRGYAEIPLDPVDSVENVQVTVEGRAEDDDSSASHQSASSTTERHGDMHVAEQGTPEEFNGTPNTFAVHETDGRLRIDYAYESTAGQFAYIPEPQTRSIIVEYDVHGAIRNYPDAEDSWQQLHRMAISDEVLDVADIRNASVTLSFPQDVAEGHECACSCCLGKRCPATVLDSQG